MPWSKHHRKEKFAALDKRRRPKRREYFKEYYHRKLKENKEAMEKELIRNKTRQKYGTAQFCIICGSKEKVTHHHYTEPYEVDKFLDLCEYHHILLDYERRYKSKSNTKEVTE
jgi:hypothetical protein